MMIDQEYVDLSDEIVISVDRHGGGWAVFWSGKPVRRFFGESAECRAQGCALAMLDGRELR